MDMMTNIIWMVALWWMFSRMLRTIRIIQYQKMLQDKQEAQGRFEQQEDQADNKHNEEITVEMVEDFVCGKFIEKSQAYQLSQGANTYYFCSWECREKYIKEHSKQSE